MTSLLTAGPADAASSVAAPSSVAAFDAADVLDALRRMTPAEQTAWLRRLESRLRLANEATLAKEQAAQRNEQLAKLLRQTTLSWELLHDLIDEVNRRERLAISQLTQRYRIEVYGSYYHDRAEYDRRLESLDRVTVAWRTSGEGFDRQDIFVQWLSEALRNARPASLGPIPPDPDFSAKSSTAAEETPPPTAPVAPATVAPATPAAVAPVTPTPTTPTTSPEPSAATATPAPPPAVEPPPTPPVAAVAPPSVGRDVEEAVVPAAEEVLVEAVEAPAVDPAALAELQRATEAAAAAILPPPVEPVAEMPVELPVPPSVETPVAAPVELPRELPVESPSETPAATETAAVVESSVTLPAGLPMNQALERAIDDTLDAFAKSVDNAAAVAPMTPPREPKTEPVIEIPSEPKIEPAKPIEAIAAKPVEITAAKPIERPTPPRVESPTANALETPAAPPIEAPAAQPKEASVAKTPIEKPVAQPHVGREAEPATSPAERLARKPLANPPPVRPSLPAVPRLPAAAVAAPPVSKVQVNVSDLAARVAGVNLSLRGIEDELSREGEWTIPRLALVTERLTVLMRRRDDLLLFYQLLDREGQAAAGTLESPRFAMVALGRQIAARQEALGGTAGRDAAADGQAELTLLAELARQLAELAEPAAAKAADATPPVVAPQATAEDSQR